MSSPRKKKKNETTSRSSNGVRVTLGSLKMGLSLAFGIWFTIASAVAAPTIVALDFSAGGASYEGIGALSGGGGVTRLLIDYEPTIQQVYKSFLSRFAGLLTAK